MIILDADCPVCGGKGTAMHHMLQSDCVRCGWLSAFDSDEECEGNDPEKIKKYDEKIKNKV